MLRPAPRFDLPTHPDDPRVGRLLGKDCTAADARVVLIGFPTDEGVKRNGGRPGAADGPDAIRQAFARLTPDPRRHYSFVELLRWTCDLGNLEVSDDLEADQQRLGEVLAPHLERGATVIVLGGGHETAYGHFLGYVQASRPITILNWDAHADVRPTDAGRGHSGSPFRQALEHPSRLCKSYGVAGLQPSSLAKEHLEYLQQRGGRILFHDDVAPYAVDELYQNLSSDTLVSFDLDALDSAAAPGVSAPAVAGLNVHLWLHAAVSAGRCPHVQSLDIVELNPRIDVDGRTARLAARTLWEFLRGLLDRAR